MVKKHIQENPLTSGTNHLLKLVAFVLKRRIQAEDQVMRLCSMFMHHFSTDRRYPQGRQTGIGWCLSHI